MKKLIAEENLRREKLGGRFILLLVVALTSLLVLRVILANRLVEASSTLRNLDAQIASLEQQNRLLSEEIRQKESLTAIKDQVQALGFIKTGKYSFLKSPSDVAQRPSQFSLLR